MVPIPTKPASAFVPTTPPLIINLRLVEVRLDVAFPKSPINKSLEELVVPDESPVWI